MTLREMKRKVLSLIEEINPNNANMTDDPDISTKINDVVNQIMFELCRAKKIAKYVETDVEEGDVYDFDKLAMVCGYDVYQVANISGVAFVPKANNTVFKFLETGTAELELFVYPTIINDQTPDSYVFELSQDVLEIMPYGVAADLLKSDISTEYGSIYAARYDQMLQELDTRYGTANIYIEGGVNI